MTHYVFVPHRRTAWIGPEQTASAATPGNLRETRRPSVRPNRSRATYL